MSDSDSDCSVNEEMIDKLDNPSIGGWNTDVQAVAIYPSEKTFKQWNSIPLDTKKEALQLLKTGFFWAPILLHHNENNTTGLAAEIGLPDRDNVEAITLKHLEKIELFEAILRALEKGCLDKGQSKHIIRMSNKFTMCLQQAFEEAIQWLDQTGEPAIGQRILELCCPPTCFKALALVFRLFAQIVDEMGTNMKRMMKTLRCLPSKEVLEESEKMKTEGNENFKKQQYEKAVKSYSESLSIYPGNHIVYGNRALCYIRSKKYLKAVVDGKRAILIKPLWPKGHYRYCEALFSLGEVEKAVEANISAQQLFKDDHERLRDLEQQQQKFIAEITEAKAALSKTSQKPRTESPLRPRKDVDKVPPAATSAAPPKSKVSGVKMENKTQPGKKEKSAQAEGAKESNKKKAKATTCRSEEPVVISKAAVWKELKSMVQDAHTALTDCRSRNAEQAFSQALALLDTSTSKELGLSKLDVQLLLYGRASALTEIGQPEELAEAQRLLEKIKSFEERLFQCLVYYAIGRVYLKENRFAVALEQFLDSLQMVKNQITPGKLTWPFTKETVKETQPDYLKETLEVAIELCKFPPVPDAICRLERCLCPFKAEIYFTDPDFKGFIQVCCCQNCILEYHVSCWKMLKTSSFQDRSEKDFLNEACFTPDCVGKICGIKIFSSTGLVKYQFGPDVSSRPQTPKKQKCPSMKKFKSKEDHRVKNKLPKPPCPDEVTVNDEIRPQRDDTAAQSQQKAWLLYRDRVLVQISQNMELLREETGLPVATLSSSLKPWLELDMSRGNQLAGRILNWQQEKLETLGQAVELLLERKNRVWARVFIHTLSTCEDINSKLKIWACRLNDAGLNAAKSFIERNAEHLEQLDLSLLLSFGPMQELVLEKLGSKPELLLSSGVSVTEYLKQAQPHDMRLFIWNLEEHRDNYEPCHRLLDDYFDMMDGHCSVLKKSDENNSAMKTKSRGRKKKIKEPKGVFVWTGARSLTPRDDSDFFEDDPLSFPEPEDPFSVPSHLRERVAEFEDQYHRDRSPFKTILDNNVDPTKEQLFDYFAQILEMHGPLVAEDQLLVGELENFPPVARLKIKEAGGFEPFLLESLRFIKMGMCIGLARHAVSLQQDGSGARLDELDVLTDPVTDSLPPDFHFGRGPVSYAQTNHYPVPPQLYTYNCQPPVLYPSVNGGTDPFRSNGDAFHSHQDASYDPYELVDLDFYSSEIVGEGWEFNPYFGGIATKTPEEILLKNHAAVQTCQEVMRSVAVNTEPDERYESCPGDINKMEKSNTEMEQRINGWKSECDEANRKRAEYVVSSNNDLEEITTNIQVTNTELALFQQKLEEEVRKDQKEKKTNQEVLKSLKLEIEELVEEQGSLTQNIRERKTKYQEKLRDFLELSNQSAAEKMSLEDEIKRFKDTVTTATRRSCTAQLSIVESSRDLGLNGLYRELADAKAFLAKLDDVLHRLPSKEVEIVRKTLRANVQEVEKNISTAETLYKEQMEQVKSGKRVSELLPVNKTNQPEPRLSPPLAAAKELAAQSSVQASHSAARPVQLSAAAEAAPTQYESPARPLESSHRSVFEMAMECLTTVFPDYSRSDLMKFMKELRSSNGGSLTSMALQDVVGGTTQLILDHQERLSSAAKSTSGSAATTPAPVWKEVGPRRATHTNALNLEDPCIICHEDMSPDDILVLMCRHSFHNECIKSWLKEHSTCPTCRDHALLSEDFPMLSGRKRQAL